MILGLILSILLITPEDSVQRARSSFDAGNYNEAVKTLTAALTPAPTDAATNASIHYWLARSYYEQRNYDRAVDNAETAVKLAPQNAEYTQWLGRAYGGKAEEGHSFFLARKVKKAFEDAVRLNPFSVDARRDLMQYLVEAPWIVGGDKKEARKQIEAITAIDPLQGQLARGSYLEADKDWKGADAEYLAIIGEKPNRIEPYMEAAAYFAGRKDAGNIERSLAAAAHLNSKDPRQDFYRAVALVLKGTELPTAEKLLKSYVANVPERSDYPSHKSADNWLTRIPR
jgi:tetratricopeptide (TPR) repeat protein